MRNSSLSCLGELPLTLLWFVLQACNNTSDRKHADSILEKYVTEIVMSIVTTFFSSPFSDQSTTLQVGKCTGTQQGEHCQHTCVHATLVPFTVQKKHGGAVEV